MLGTPGLRGQVRKRGKLSRFDANHGEEIRSLTGASREGWQRASVCSEMSLTDLLTNPRTRAKARAVIDPLLPTYNRTIPASLLVPRLSPHPQLVGIAFDYGVRMEAEYLAGSAASAPWVAEVAAERLPKRSSERRKAAAIVKDAREAAKHWPDDGSSRHAEIAFHATKSGQLDQVVRARLPPTFGPGDGVLEDGISTEVVELLRHADPLWDAIRGRDTWLNPTFGVASALVGGADADLVVGDTLVEIKTTKSGAIERDQMRQLVGYACLGRASGAHGVNNVAVYASRFGRLEMIPPRGDVTDGKYRRTAAQLGEIWNELVAA